MKSNQQRLGVLVASAGIILGWGIPAHSLEFNESAHSRCVEARDYQGCLKSQLRSGTTRSVTGFDVANSEAGDVIAEFQALQGDSGCKITLYENVADVCGQFVGRNAIKEWSSYRIEALIGICIKDTENSIAFLSKDGTDRAVSFTFINIKTIREFDNRFIVWSRMLPNRIAGNC